MLCKAHSHIGARDCISFATQNPLYYIQKAFRSSCHNNWILPLPGLKPSTRYRHPFQGAWRYISNTILVYYLQRRTIALGNVHVIHMCLCNSSSPSGCLATTTGGPRLTYTLMMKSGGATTSLFFTSSIPLICSSSASASVKF